MPFPEVVARATSKQTSQVTSHPVSLPPTIVAGDLLVMAFAFMESTSWTAPTDWKYVSDQRAIAGDPSDPQVFVYGKRADGSEGATVTVATIAATRSVHRTWRIRSHSPWWVSANDDTPSGARGCLGGAGGDGNSAAPECFVFNPQDWLDADFLWLAIAVAEDGQAFTGFPPSYDNTFTDTTGTGVNHISLATAERLRHSAAETPGLFALGAAQPWATITVSVGPNDIRHMMA